MPKKTTRKRASGPLAEYRRKRDFSRTEEPPRDRKRAGPKLAFVIQKHAASRLHFDLRLELDGVMKSWAVPKGPSLDPAVKRLAMQVEDHPIDYNHFEGTIPEGRVRRRDGDALGSGNLRIRRRRIPTRWKGLREGYAKGDFKFVLRGKRLRGSWVLVRIRRGDPKRAQWLLIKHRDEFADPGSDGVGEHDTSVATGRTMEEIAAGKRRGK